MSHVGTDTSSLALFDVVLKPLLMMDERNTVSEIPRPTLLLRQQQKWFLLISICYNSLRRSRTI